MKKLLVFILILMMVIPVQAFAGISPEEPSEKATGINGMFEILMKTDNQWENAGSLGFGKFQETKEIDLGEYLKGTNALIKISQQGGGASYLDAVFLDGMQAVKANGSEGKVLNKLAKEDLDITPVEDGIILEFSSYKGEGILSVTGRIENELISQEPLQFPLANNYKHKYQIRDFYNYKLNTNYRKIAVDGVLDEVENLEAFAQEYQVPGSGHPAGDTYFWVMNDDENLYVAMDIIQDNTNDGDKDYSKVYVNTSQGIKEFKVSAQETKWGNTSFTYTDRVVYEHKVCEFAIPLNEIGGMTDELELAFVVYGTLSLPPVVYPDLAYDTVNKIYLCVFDKDVNQTWIDGKWSYVKGIYGQFVYLDDDGYSEIVTEDFPITTFSVDRNINANPAVAYDTESDAFLIVWRENGTIMGNTLKVNSVNRGDAEVGYSIDPDKEFIISTYPDDSSEYYANSPEIAFDNVQNKFLVVWEDLEKQLIDGKFVSCIKGKFVKLNTSGLTPEIDDDPMIISIQVNFLTGGNFLPSVCYSEEYESFLVVWLNNDKSIDMIQARIINGTGENPPPDDITDIIVIEDNELNLAYKFKIPSVSINDCTNQFLVTWDSCYDYYYFETHGAYIDLSKITDSDLSKITSDALIKLGRISPEYENSMHSTSFFDGGESMLCLWNQESEDSERREGYIKMKTIGQPGINGTNRPEHTYYDSNVHANQFIASCGNGKGQILVAYGRSLYINDVETFPIGYRFIGEPEEPAYIEEYQPDLAYHSELDIYLSVFTGNNILSDVRESHIYGQLVDNEGNPIGEIFLINDGTDNEDAEDDGCLQLPSVAVDENNNFLVAWSQGFSDDKIYASKVEITKSGNSYNVDKEPAFRVSDNKYDSIVESSPNIAYDSLNDRFLIVWQQYISYGSSDDSWNIYGSIVDIEGNFIKDTFAIDDTEGSDQERPSVSFSTKDNKYLVAYKDDTTYVYARVIGDDGEVYRSNRIATAPLATATNPNVSYNDGNEKFLISWSNLDHIKGAYYSISYDSEEPYVEREGEIEFDIDESDYYYRDIYPAAYFDGADSMLCVWNPGSEYGLDSLSSSDFAYSSMFAKLRYFGNEGPVGDTFNTDNAEIVALEEPIAITGNLKGQFLIAYEVVGDGNIGSYGIQALDEYGPECSTIDYRLIGELRVDPYLEFINDPYRVQVGNTIQAEVNYFDGETDIDVTNNVTYVSVNPEIATVSTSGAIKGEAVGDTYIEAYYSTYINDVATTISAIAARVDVYKKSSPGPSPQKTIIGQVIVDGKVIKDIYAEDLVSDGGIYSFEASKTGDNAKLWLLGSYYKQIADKNPNGVLQLVWDAASYNLPLKSGEVLKEVNNITGSKVNIIIEKVDDEKLIESAAAAVDKLGGKMVSGLVDFSVTVEGKSKEVNIDKYSLYVERTIDQLNKLDAYSTTAMKLLENDEFTFAPSVFGNNAATIKYRGNGIFAIVNNPKSFSDIAAHWSKMNVEKLAARNIAFGKSDGLFAPNDYVTRAEFAVMITRALGITEEEGTMNFEDVQGWYAEDISTAYDAGLINGRGDGKFYPNERIQRKDMSVIIHNALKFADKVETVKNKDSVLSMFTDSSKIDEYAKGSVALCAEAGIIMGRNTKEFDPDENATRAEASAIIERMLRYLEFIN